MAREIYNAKHRPVSKAEARVSAVRHAFAVFRDGMLPILVFEAFRPVFEHGITVIDAMAGLGH